MMRQYQQFKELELRLSVTLLPPEHPRRLRQTTVLELRISVLSSPVRSHEFFAYH